MNIEILADNLRRLRSVNKLSQSKLAERADVSLPTIKNLEIGKAAPKVNTMLLIAKALGVGLEQLFAPVKILKTVRFRSTKQMRNRSQILAEVSGWLDDFNMLEKLLNVSAHYMLSKIAKKSDSTKPEKIAESCRSLMKLSHNEPIRDICGLLEHSGIKVMPISSASPGFFGLSVGEEDDGPAIVVNIRDGISVERQIFSAAHELGHLLMHQSAYDVENCTENKHEEYEANAFASHFLMPDKAFLKEWEEASGLHVVDRVLKVRSLFNVSYKTVLYRLVELKLADETVWVKFNFAFQAKYRKQLSNKIEPDALEPFGNSRYAFYEDRFRLLVRKAIDTDKISLSRAAEMLRIKIEEMHDLVQMWSIAS
jgi:Zn-dependent peptidase ImmA (M78 family)/DNA-binding XRE family transcriptional regulator